MNKESEYEVTVSNLFDKEFRLSIWQAVQLLFMFSVLNVVLMIAAKLDVKRDPIAEGMAVQLEDMMRQLK